MALLNAAAHRLHHPALGCRKKIDWDRVEEDLKREEKQEKPDGEEVGAGSGPSRAALAMLEVAMLLWQRCPARVAVPSTLHALLPACMRACKPCAACVCTFPCSHSVPPPTTPFPPFPRRAS